MKYNKEKILKKMKKQKKKRNKRVIKRKGILKMIQAMTTEIMVIMEMKITQYSL